MSTSSTIRRSAYTWDFENRLSSATLSNGSGLETFRYDPFGRRIQKIWPNTANNSTRVRNYLYDGANIVTELNASGAVEATSPTTMPTDSAL
jgi:YD repeat-containing protein